MGEDCFIRLYRVVLKLKRRATILEISASLIFLPAYYHNQSQLHGAMSAISLSFNFYSFRIMIVLSIMIGKLGAMNDHGSSRCQRPNTLSQPDTLSWAV